MALFVNMNRVVFVLCCIVVLLSWSVERGQWLVNTMPVPIVEGEKFLLQSPYCENYMYRTMLGDTVYLDSVSKGLPLGLYELSCVDNDSLNAFLSVQ